MTVYDSSVLIDYLDGNDAAVEYVENAVNDTAVAPPIVWFEVYQGEVYRTGPTDFPAVDRALSWLTTVDTTAKHARAVASLQDSLNRRGRPLAARDALIAGVAIAEDERLVATDTDFDVDGITEHVDVVFP